MSKKSSLLIDTEDMLIVLTPLAVLIGDREAIALQQIHYWIEINRKADKTATHFKDGLWWTYNTWKEWQVKNFPFWSTATIQRIFESLYNKDLIILKAHEDRNKGSWVTILYGELEDVKNAGKPLRKRNSKRVGSSQTDKTPHVKLTRPRKRKGSQTDKPIGTTETSSKTPPSVAPNGSTSRKPKTKADTVRSKPLSYAEQHPELSQAELDAIRRKAIDDSTAQSNREIARQRNFAALEKSVKVLPGVSGKLATQYAHMLNGTATKGVYAEYRIEGGITAVEFETFVGWYCIKYPTQGLPKEVEKLYGYVNEWIDAGKPAAPTSNGTHKTALDRAYETMNGGEA